MAKIDEKMKGIFLGVLVWTILLSIISVWVYFSMEHRQAKREMIYYQAQKMAQEQKRERLQEYEQRRLRDQMTREYNKGHVVGGQPANP